MTLYYDQVLWWETAEIVKTNPDLANVHLKSEVTTAAKGTGITAYIYLPPEQEGL